MSGFISKKGSYVISLDEFKKSDRKKLKKIKPYSDNPNFKKKSFSIYEEITLKDGRKFVLLPRHFGIKEYGVGKNLCPDGPHESFPRMAEEYKPKKYQKEAIDSILKDYRSGSMGGLLHMSPGSGKTFTSICIMTLIGRRTFIVTDQCRYDQWIREILKFIPDLKKSDIGVLQNSPDGKVLTDPSIKIVISTINTIAMGKFRKEKYSDFGFVIMDEIDSYITPMMIKVFPYLTRRYVLGMSATLTRPDRLGYLIKWYVGEIKYTCLLAYKGAPIIVRKIVYKSDNEHVYRIDKWSGKKVIDPTNTYKLVMNDERRERVIICLIMQYYTSKNGKGKIKSYGSEDGVILVVGLYRAQLERLYKKLLTLIPKEILGIYYGAKTKADKIELKRVTRECKVVLAIRQMGYRGLDIPKADVMIMASSYIPKNQGKNTESLGQLIGRITRKDHEKNPILVDIVDDFGFFEKHGRLRSQYYSDKGYDIYREVCKV